ncbi:uncharacterized protein LOC133893499 [Phragmites australis]|uniref:uncharacterized protein LOC133893499 n=1 Tax=Phragmites australis TaxID=29695 RepID=UPI002D779A8F|nr:uncharacterized protein LOC133893499 [Phragmites australis]
MESQGTHRRAGEARGVVGGGGTTSIAKHVGIQNQVLKWLQDFSDKVEERAKGAAAEVNGLLEEAGTLELDMKTAVLAFDNLTRQRFTEHKISDEDNTNLKMRDNIQSSMQSQVQAQDYERDILPRYKEALHIGLASCKDHFRKKGRSTTSVFRAMSTNGPLPHIIGSEEYNHDNSCGLADDVQPLTDDFSWLQESQGESSDFGAGDLFQSQMPGVQQGFEKGETESLVSAAREFKAMLEAALVNPYKFYDDVSTTAQDASVENTSTSDVHHNTDPVSLIRMGEAAGERSTEADNAEETKLLASLQDPDINVHDLYSALVREGLFDAGDEILAMDPASGSVNPATADSTERPFSMNETIPSEDKKSIEVDDTAFPSDQNDGVSESS